MALAKYISKRNFKESPEPKGGKSTDDKLRFVIQKHDASHLHYDFRLEMEGVLKSWAIPKGPSTDPSVKRLAMMVEDHPYDYRDFEGVIPTGYGAGTVIIWDEGFYELIDAKEKDKNTQDKELRHQLYKGSLKFVLHGKKLKGEFALVKMHGKGENSWLLLKHNDKYASIADITKKDKSVISNKTLVQIEKHPTHIYGSKSLPKKEIENSSDKKSAVIKTTKKISTDIISLFRKTKKANFPAKIKPMLATLVDKPFDANGWLYEIKWDGYRAIAFMNKGKFELKSRNEKSFNEKFYPVAEAIKNWNIKAVVDGEIVVLNNKGISDFGALQNWRSEADGDLFYYVFDIIWYDGKDITQLPLIERREILKAIIPKEGLIKLSKNFKESGTHFFEAAKQTGLEGIIAKKENSIYSFDDRGNDWLKIKANKRQEMVIGGYTKNDDTSKKFSALLVGVFDGKELVYTGKIGTGFSDKTQIEMIKQFKPFIINHSPFSELPDINKPSRFRPDPPHAKATWLKPQLICEVSFTEMTKDGVMRHPSFEGMRIDKNAKDVVRETEKQTSNAIKKVKEESTKNIVTPSAKRDRKTFLNPGDETQVREINGCELKFTNLSKIYWPKEKIMKRDMLNYYYQVAPYILPYLKDRPQSMNRHPDGIEGKNFFYKDVTGKVPDWVETYNYHSESDGRDKKYLVAKDEASLLYMASLGCIEMNPWNSRVNTEDYPDWCIIDLDPSAKNNFNQVIQAALATKDILDNMGIKSYPKTSGSTGMHIYIPMGAKYTYEQSKEFARFIVKLVVEKLPKLTSIQRVVKDRGGKMYLDFLQNRLQATVAAPYSLRPKPGATVSMPLHWDEVEKGLKMKDFTIYNAIERIKSEGDIFKAVLGKGINLEKIIKDFSPAN
jgi:bifunctional non-homologous end joining protein LigD